MPFFERAGQRHATLKRVAQTLACRLLFTAGVQHIRALAGVACSVLSGRARRAAAAAHAPCLGRCRTFLVPLYGIQFIRMESMQRTPPGAWRRA